MAYAIARQGVSLMFSRIGTDTYQPSRLEAMGIYPYSVWRYNGAVREPVIMPRFKPKGVLERDPLADLWKHTLSRIPSVFGRLAYLASLRDPNSGLYRHHGLSLSFGREDSARALQDSHKKVFGEWLNFPLAPKSSDLAEYLAGLEDDSAVVAATWLRNGHFRQLAPDQATRAQRLQFEHELGTLLSMIRNVPGAAPLVPDSTQPA
jgi:hypothetical protein